MQESFEPLKNTSEDAVLIDDEKLSRMTDEAILDYERLKKEDPRVDRKRAVDRVVKRFSIPQKQRDECADLIHGRMVERTSHRWETEGVKGSSEMPVTETIEPEFVERQSGREPPEGWFTKWQNESEDRREQIHREITGEQ